MRTGRFFRTSMNRIDALILALTIISIANLIVTAQQPSVPVMELYGSGVPTSNCTPPQRYFQTNSTAGNNIWLCTDTNLWTNVTSGGGSGIPAGAIIFINTGACPAGYTEVAGLDGRMVLGTLNANANVGTTGGNDNITPAGTNGAQTFTGSALGTHAHSAGTYANSGGSVNAHSGSAVADHASHTHDYTQVPNHVHPYCSQTATTGGASSYEHGAIDASSAATECSMLTNNPSGGVATGTTVGPSATLTHGVTQPANHTFTQPTIGGSSEAISGGTPAGTVTVPAFTGTSFDNRSAFVRLIGCKKD